MKKYVGIIRGINVGGHHKVNMQLLREGLEKAKLSDVRTYIQSGNLVFAADGATRALEALIGQVLMTTFEVDVPVIVRDEKAWKQTVKKNPFLSETDDHTKLLVTFLSDTPVAAKVNGLSGRTFPHDDYAVVDKDIYLYCRAGYGKTDIPNLFFEKHLGVTGTTRNWRSVLKLAEMLEE